MVTAAMFTFSIWTAETPRAAWNLQVSQIVYSPYNNSEGVLKEKLDTADPTGRAEVHEANPLNGLVALTWSH
jgi:hypothetical protein